MTKYTGNVGRLPSGRWQVRIKEHGAVTLASFDTQSEARRFAAAFKSRQLYAHAGIQLPGGGAAPASARVHELLDEYLAGLEREQRSRTGIRSARQCIEVVRGFFHPATDAAKVGPETVREYWQWRLANARSLRGTTGGAILHELAYLKAALRRGGFKPELTVPPDLRRRVQRRERRVPSPREIRRLLLEMPADSPERAFCEFLALTGARPGEARALLWRQVDLAAGRAEIHRTKTARVQALRLSPAAVAALARWRDVQTSDPAGHVFTLDGRPLLDLSLRKRITRAAKAAGLPWFQPYTLRHAYIGAQLDSGRPIHKVAQDVGHDQPTTTMIYALQEARGEASTAMDEAVWGAQKQAGRVSLGKSNKKARP